MLCNGLGRMGGFRVTAFSFLLPQAILLTILSGLAVGSACGVGRLFFFRRASCHLGLLLTPLRKLAVSPGHRATLWQVSESIGTANTVHGKKIAGIELPR
jgi:hypothetical protein